MSSVASNRLKVKKSILLINEAWIIDPSKEYFLSLFQFILFSNKFS